MDNHLNKLIPEDRRSRSASNGMEPRYDHKAMEEKIYKTWEEFGYFNPDVCVKNGVTKPDAEPFAVALPPPNVTGTLHIGHAFEHAIQDIMVRFSRMRGKRTLWIPGTDHAALATPAKVEKEIYKKEGKTRHDLGREEFLKRVDAFAKESHDTIIRQVKRLGASLDWSREAYTLDESRNLAVRTAFKTMYDLGLIYRGNRVVNWDPKGQTVISDDEVTHEERKAKLYTFRYDKNFPISISTTRPETKLGDTGVAVNPDDLRYKKFVGQEFKVNFVGFPLTIKIIADRSVEKDFGTGALGVTPAHSMIDWEMAQEHGLPLVQVIDERAKMTAEGPLHGKKTLEAREWIVEELRKNGLLEKEEEIVQNISVSERSGGIIEPLPKKQWFVNVNKPFHMPPSKIDGIADGQLISLKELMQRVATGPIKFFPDRFRTIYLHWIDNLRDWCISRQIWFGHRIPIWYKDNEIYCGIDAPKGSGWEQDPDTLDTWFSSGMWTFSTLGWPEKTEDLKTYHPTAFMDPGYEILFLWVARMILMSGCLLGEVPFKTVLIHGIVRDKQGRKFSKSLGNGIDPLVLADTYGADAVRMSLIIGAAPGSDVKFDESKTKGYRNFSTKIWNAARFVLMNRPEKTEKVQFDTDDEKLLEELHALKNEVTNHIEAFDFHLAGEKLYHYFWHTFADKIIEAAKPRLQSDDNAEKNRAYMLLETILLESIKMLHPFMPFITEEIYQKFQNKKGDLLMVAPWD